VNWVTGKLSGVEDSGKFWASLGRDPRTIRLEEYVSVDRAVANARDFVESIPFLVEICGSGLVLKVYVARKPQFLREGL